MVVTPVAKQTATLHASVPTLREVGITHRQITVEPLGQGVTAEFSHPYYPRRLSLIKASSRRPGFVDYRKKQFARQQIIGWNSTCRVTLITNSYWKLRRFDQRNEIGVKVHLANIDCCSDIPSCFFGRPYRHHRRLRLQLLVALMVGCTLERNMSAIYESCDASLSPSYLTTPLISYQGLRRSAKVMHLMLQYYWRIYSLSIDDYFKCYPQMSFISAVVYQVDEQVESAQQQGSAAALATACNRCRTSLDRAINEFGLMTSSLRREVDRAVEYLQLEARLLMASEVSVDELRLALLLRSSDLRILHRLALGVLHLPCDEDLFRLLEPLETMAEIRDDLYQYAEDQASNSFNSYSILERSFGEEAPRRLQTERLYNLKLYEARAPAVGSALRKRLKPVVQEVFAQNDFRVPGMVSADTGEFA